MSCNPNPLDACSRALFQCNNPCFTSTPGCDLLPTQVDTFTLQFFGNDLGKILSGDSISWALPCGLDTGLASNPRQAGESLACYFLRLFEAGIPGTIGAQGEPGLPGQCGKDAFTVTLQDFTQPSLSAPYVSVFTRAGNSLVENLPVEVQGSGYYMVVNAESDGTVLLRLTQPFSGAPSVIPAGAIVIASGLPGGTVKGPRGPQGIQGIPGPQGSQGIPGDSIQGPQGPTIHLPSGKAPSQNTLNTFALNGTYHNQGLAANDPKWLRFVPPDNSVSTYFILYRLLLVWFNGAPGPPTTSGSIFVQIELENGGATPVDGTERVFKIVSAPGGTGNRLVTIPLIVTNNTGVIPKWTVYGKHNLGAPAQAFIIGFQNCVTWFKF